MSIIEKTLPFPRGAFYSEAHKGTGALVTMGDSTAKNLEGRRYQVEDTIHKTGKHVILRVVKNDAGRDMTCSRRIVTWSSTTTNDWGNRVNDFGAAGEPGKPIDDAYYYGPQPKYTTGLELTIADRAVETTISDNDLFYVVDEGPCDIEATTNANGIAAGIPFFCAGTGSTYDGLIAEALDGNLPLGVCLEAPSATTSITACLVEVSPGLAYIRTRIT